MKLKFTFFLVICTIYQRINIYIEHLYYYFILESSSSSSSLFFPKPLNLTPPPIHVPSPCVFFFFFFFFTFNFLFSKLCFFFLNKTKKMKKFFIFSKVGLWVNEWKMWVTEREREGEELGKFFFINYNKLEEKLLIFFFSQLFSSLLYTHTHTQIYNIYKYNSILIPGSQIFFFFVNSINYSSIYSRVKFQIMRKKTKKLMPNTLCLFSVSACMQASNTNFVIKWPWFRSHFFERVRNGEK